MNWLVAHKHLAIVIVVAAFAFYATAKVVSHMDGVAHDQRVLAEAQLAKDKDAQKAADAQAQKDRQAYDLLKSQLDSQNAQLRGQIAALAASLSVQQAKDKALPPPELASRWETLIGGVPGDIKPVPDGLVANLDASRKTVILLEEVPVLRQQVVVQGQIIENKDKELDKQSILVTDWSRATDACKVTLKQTEDTCKAQRKDDAAKARKGKWKAFGAGILAAVSIYFGVHH